MIKFKKKPKRSRIEKIKTQNIPSEWFDKFWRKMPDDVRRVWLDDMASLATGFTTLEAIQRRELAEVLNPQYFKWDNKYHSIPQSVHDAYKAEKYPNGQWFDAFLKDGDTKSHDYSEVSCGLIEQINNTPSYVYDPSKFKFQSILDSIAESWELDRQKKEQERLDRERDIELWNKHYGPYNLEWRD